MSDLTYAEYRDMWERMTDAERDRLRRKCAWERMSPWQVLNSWPSLRLSAVSGDTQTNNERPNA